MSTRYSKPVKRVMPVTIKDGGGGHRSLIVTLHGNLLELRLFKRSKSYFVDLEHAYFGAIRAESFKARMEKAKIRAAKKRGK